MAMDLETKMKNDIEENLMVGVLDIVILKLLKEKDMYGYQIKQEIHTRSNEEIHIKDGTLYGPLYRMEKKGMISVRRELVGQRRFRMYYHLEESGSKYLEIGTDSFNKIMSGAMKVLK